MALFNRRSPQDAPAQSPSTEDVALAPDTVAAEESVPQVGISVSTYGQPLGASSPTPEAPTGEAPTPAEDSSGIADNELLRGTLSAMEAEPTPQDVMHVMRQSLQGTLYVRARGDAGALIEAGEEITLAVSSIGEDRFLIVFSGPSALREAIEADGNHDTSAIGQPSGTILANVLEGPYAGLMLDHATEGARIILPRQLIEKAMDEAGPDFVVKNLLTRTRSEDTASQIVAALLEQKFWVAAGQPDDSGEFGIAESRDGEGARHVELFSHPLEVVAMGRGDSPIPLTAEQLGGILASDEGISGLVVDPAGPWIQLSRADLAPIIALG